MIGEILLICLISCILFVPTLMILSVICWVISKIFLNIANLCMNTIKIICNF